MPDEFLLTRRRPSTTGVAVWAFWPSAAGLCTARWQAGHRKLPKNQRGTYREVLVFWRPSAKVAAKCSFVLLGAGPRLQPARTLGVIAMVHRTMQTALMLRILLHMQRGTIRRRAPREAQRPGDRSHRNLREAWPADINEWTTAPLQYGGILFGTPPSLMQQLRHCLGKPDGW